MQINLPTSLLRQVRWTRLRISGGSPNDKNTNSDNGFVFLYYKKMRCKASHSVGTDDHEQMESQARSMRPAWRVRGSPRNAWLQLRCKKFLNIRIKKQQPLLLLFGASSGTRRKPEASVIESMQVYLQKRTSTLNKRCCRTTVHCTGHCVSCLFAMSAAHDFRKCYALASLFACGQTGVSRVRHATRGCNYVA